MKSLVALFLHVGSIVMLVLVSTSKTRNMEVSYNLLAIILLLIFLLIVREINWEEGVYLHKLWFSGWLVFAVSIIISVTAILLGTSFAGYAFLLVVISALAFLIL